MGIKMYDLQHIYTYADAMKMYDAFTTHNARQCEFNKYQVKEQMKAKGL